jgi:hypothetical protein
MIQNALGLLQTHAHIIFWASAFAGTLLFALRIVSALVGNFTDFADDFDLDIDAPDGLHHTTPSFKIFSLHTLAGFFMMFGWVGLACSNQLGWSYVSASLMAFGVGFLMMVLTAWIFRGASMLESSGSQFDIKKTIGLSGHVYQRIPKDGQGKVSLSVNGITRELMAQTADGQDLESFITIKIVKVVGDDVVEVTANFTPGKD